MDALNAVLETLHLKSTVFCRSDLTAPWGIEIPSFGGDRAGFHVVTRGSCWLEVEGIENQIPLEGGDLIVLPHGHGHCLRDKPETSAVKLENLLASRNGNNKGFIYGGGGQLSNLVCGCFQFDGKETNPLIASLPPVLHIKGEEGRAVPWLETTLQFLSSETSSPSPGSEALIGHLTEILFIQAVRAHIKSVTCCNGWLKALVDPQIGKALALMHTNPQEAWTVARIASQVGMSRSAFSAHFRALVGEPPLQYLTRWRMHKAANLLRSKKDSLAEIASQIGYEAEAAFSKAFKRWIGSAPGTYRQTQTAQL